jgi:hypothetical protein
MTHHFVADVLLISIGTALADSSPVHQDFRVQMGVGIAVDRPIQAANNMLYFYKGEKLWQHK